MKLIHWSLQAYQNKQYHKWQLRGVGHSTSVRTKIPDKIEQDHGPQEQALESWTTLKTRYPLPSFLQIGRNWDKKGRVDVSDVQSASGRDAGQVSWHHNWESSSTKKSSDGVSGYLPQLEAFQHTSQQEVLRNVWWSFSFYFMTHQSNADPITTNPLLVYGLFKAGT